MLTYFQPERDQSQILLESTRFNPIKLSTVRLLRSPYCADTEFPQRINYAALIQIFLHWALHRTSVPWCTLWEKTRALSTIFLNPIGSLLVFRIKKRFLFLFSPPHKAKIRTKSRNDLWGRARFLDPGDNSSKYKPNYIIPVWSPPMAFQSCKRKPKSCSVLESFSMICFLTQSYLSAMRPQFWYPWLPAHPSQVSAPKAEKSWLI